MMVYSAKIHVDLSQLFVNFCDERLWTFQRRLKLALPQHKHQRISSITITRTTRTSVWLHLIFSALGMPARTVNNFYHNENNNYKNNNNHLNSYVWKYAPGRTTRLHVLGAFNGLLHWESDGFPPVPYSACALLTWHDTAISTLAGAFKKNTLTRPLRALGSSWTGSKKEKRQISGFITFLPFQTHCCGERVCCQPLRYYLLNALAVLSCYNCIS